MYYKHDILHVVAPTGCIINAMDLKFFPNTIMLLKVDLFEGFSNRSNVDELVINSTSGCNCNNYKLIVQLKCNFTHAWWVHAWLHADIHV